MYDVKTKTSEYLSIVVTHECNKKCAFCVDAYRGRKEYITEDSVKKALDFAKENEIKDILFVGGEPMLHPFIGLFLAMAKYEYGFRTILTTNYSNPKRVRRYIRDIDCLNISYYGQSDLPKKLYGDEDITISALIHKEQLSTKRELDAFIDNHAGVNLKFSTLSVCNEWTKENQKVAYLDKLDAEKIVLFDEIEGLIYRDQVIKRYDKIINESAEQSYKCHVDGSISKSWVRDIN